MALLLISRGSFSGSQLIRQCLCETADFKCLTREDLVAVVNTRGEIANRIVASIEKATENYAKFTAQRRPYEILMRLALLEYVRRGNVAYFGYSGHLLLPHVAHAARVRIIAPPQMRIALLMEREKLTHEQARERIRQDDQERGRWARFMYGKNLSDPAMFDLCINLERISFPTASAMLADIAEQKEFKPTPESLAAVENSYLCARVLAALLDNAKTLELEVGATAQDGRMVLEGPYLDDPERSTVIEIARAVPGVAEVQYREGYAPLFDMLS
ncbi:MAG: cytidylate kinase family protein [Candidatus Binataceae bacterium]